MEIKDIKDAIDEASKSLKSGVEGAKEQAAEALKKAGEIITSLEGKADKKEMDDLKELLKKTQAHADELDIKFQKAKSGGKVQVKSLIEVIEENKDKIEASVKQKGAEFEFEVKADTLRASVENNPDFLALQDVGQLATRKLHLYDFFPKVPVGPGNNGTVKYTDWDEATSTRAAAMIAEGGTFPESTAKWKTYSLDLKKVGDSIPMSEELIYDAPRFAGELIQFISTNVAIKVDDQLYGGDNTGNNIKGIVNYVPAYTPVASGIADASTYDLIVKVSEDITKSAGSKYSPDFILMNITEINKMKLKKDSYNNYIIPPFVSRDGSQVDGKIVFECNVLPNNTMIMGDKRYARIFEQPGITVATALVGDDFLTDMQHLKARRRLAFLIRKADEGGFRKVTSISAALTTLATA